MILNLKSPSLKFSISGLRGIYPIDINPGNLPILANALNHSLPKGPLALARDNRPTGKAIEQIVAGTLNACGRDVHQLGLIPTPTIKAYINRNELPGGIMISASHNPVEYTAFKLIGKQGFFFNQSQNQKFHNMLSLEQNWGSFNKQGKTLQNAELAISNHIEEAIAKLELRPVKNLRIAIDCVGAAATVIAERFLRRLSVQVFSVHNTETDFFPRPPEPVPSSLKKLSQLVVANQCHLGFAFDPDADRLALVNAQGKPVGEELTLPLCAMAAFKVRQGDIVVNLSTSFLNQRAADLFGRKLHRAKVGEANVVDLMIRKKAAFGGEGNGGVIDPQLFSFGRDSIAGMGWILKLLNEKPDLDSHIQKLGTTSMIKTSLKAVGQNLPQIFNKVKKEFPEFKVNEKDGLHLSQKAGLPWIHLRGSNTEPIIRLIVESYRDSTSRSIIKTIEKLLKHQA